MLSVAKLSPGQERYYERSVASGLDDYYAGRGESPGAWTGRGAAVLGLEGTVGDGQLGTLMNGTDPASGRRLRRHGKARTITVERIDPKTGETRLEQQELAPVAGFDLVFSVPKSVSILHALGDERMRCAVADAHEEAWRAALAYLEDEACVIRTGKGGTGRERAPGFVAAAYQHRTSRAKDPHLHTHVVVANHAVGADGKWRALDGEAILATYRLAAGYLYQAQLRATLTRSLGVEWEAPAKGMAEIAGVPREVLVEFSQRSRQIEEALDIVDDESWHAARNAALDTRDRKDAIDLPALRSEWRARASSDGFDAEAMHSVLDRTTWKETTANAELAIEQRLLSRRGLTELQTTFSDADAIKALAESEVAGADAVEIRTRAARLVTRDGVERLDDAVVGRAARYSTHELMAAELRALAIVDRARDAGAPAVRRINALRAVNAQPVRLSNEQVRMVEACATTRDRIACVVGVAGAGKTTATRALVQALESGGIRVLGAAPSGAAAVKLGTETGMPASTIHRLLVNANREDGLPCGCVVIVDEAGMTDTRTLEALLHRVEQAGGKAVLIGDPEQLPSVGAGGLFPEIIERLGAVELHENRRQVDPTERAALAALRDGAGRSYVAWAAANARIVSNDNPVALRQRMLADWWRHARHDPAENVMIALRRRDVRELNALARGLMDAAGLLGPERIVAGGREFAVGDWVVCLRNDDRIGVRNGTRGSITGVNVESRSLVIDTGAAFMAVPSEYLDQRLVRYGYALTGHSAQGTTVDRAFALATDGTTREWGYVGLSRARVSTKVFCVDATTLSSAVARGARPTLAVRAAWEV